MRVRENAPALPKSCTTLVPVGTIETGPITAWFTFHSNLHNPLKHWYDRTGRTDPALPKACTTLAPNGND